MPDYNELPHECFAVKCAGHDVRSVCILYEFLLGSSLCLGRCQVSQSILVYVLRVIPYLVLSKEKLVAQRAFQFLLPGILKDGSHIPSALVHSYEGSQGLAGNTASCISIDVVRVEFSDFSGRL